MKATVKDLRFQSCELLNTVSRGEEIIITCIGRPCAKLVPYQNEGKKNKKTNYLVSGKTIRLFILLTNMCGT